MTIIRDNNYKKLTIHQRLLLEVKKVSLTELNWKKPLASQVISEAQRCNSSTLEDSWTNPAFGPEYAESQNEGTYVTNAIAPAIRASLKDLPYGSSSFVSTAERQSSASADRKGEGRRGRKLDTMFIIQF
ncbi:hypothetical protein C2G38_2188140 [Gigaspora rosea]|uniref:Uncharacterized protein n=1 Tax=Gigaspora rosea TaxID=44941 RepID=A0A397VAY8_9GLOM|nr:hypothetical protein C2G38_2188140 [Gigaspora rosea]